MCKRSKFARLVYPSRRRRSNFSSSHIIISSQPDKWNTLIYFLNKFLLLIALFLSHTRFIRIFMYYHRLHVQFYNNNALLNIHSRVYSILYVRILVAIFSIMIKHTSPIGEENTHSTAHKRRVIIFMHIIIIIFIIIISI